MTVFQEMGVESVLPNHINDLGIILFRRQCFIWWNKNNYAIFSNIKVTKIERSVCFVCFCVGGGGGGRGTPGIVITTKIYHWFLNKSGLCNIALTGLRTTPQRTTLDESKTEDDPHELTRAPNLGALIRGVTGCCPEATAARTQRGRTEVTEIA